MEKLINKANEMTNDQMVEALEILGTGYDSRKNTLVRAAILTAYENRNGADAVDQLMDNLGF